MKLEVRTTRCAAMVIGAALALLLLAAAAPAGASAEPITISVLSGRADLVSGGDALVRIGGVSSTNGLKVTVGGTNRTKAFAKRADGAVVGLVRGLKLGRSAIIARAGTRAAQLMVTNHPKSGPIFSGPQLQPWKCQATAKDAQCNEPAKFTYVYKSTDPSKSGFQPYDPANPPSDVATTKTQNGQTLPFIVRIETGYLDRDQYQIAVLFRPGKPWAAVAPQPQFNHKLLIHHGASCGADHQTGSAPGVTDSEAEHALGLGFATMSHALDNAGHNCNLASEAESLIMTKEYLIDHYGTLRYTIGTGCSGGSLAEQWIANAYPGVYQGIMPTCSFPDAWSTATQFLDYHQTLRYFKDPTHWGAGVAWTQQQMADVEGGPDGVVNAQVSDSAQFHVVIPTDPCAGVSDQQRYEPTTNPGGVRCAIQDAAINVFGPRPMSVWTPQEKQIGRGFADTPVDNVGVQYGLGALQQGQITPAQFVDLNQKVGGLDPDANHTLRRMRADHTVLANAYRSGMINETNNLNRTAIIDCRGPNPGLFHDAYRAFAVRARLNRAHGNHANQLIWEGPVVLTADNQCGLNAFLALNRWLAAVEKDQAQGTVAQKVARDKPKDLTDRCYDGSGHKLSNGLCPGGVVNVEGTPRTVAGDAITTDTNKCQLKPLNRSDNYGPIAFTDQQWAKMQTLFSNGVCDFSKRGVAQQGTVPWMTYQDAQGKVIYGGRPLGAPPTSKVLHP
ncbi:MAG: DUF6351 family protein [Solirubrobacterales bacterium]